MRIAVCVACVAQAFEAAGQANGVVAQHLFSSDTLWLYWIFAAFWLSTGIKAVWKGVA